MERTKKLDIAISSALLAAAIVVAALVTPGFLAMRRPDLIRKGPGVTRVALLSEYFPDIKGSVGDTDVYILDSGKPGGSALVLGGTHENEPAGFMAAILFVENALPTAGRLFVIPRVNASGATHADPMEGTPHTFTIDAASGKRSFRFGSRATNPVDQWPDPDIYIHASSGQRLSGSETRNLNRAYPGRLDGTFTEKIAYAVTSLIRKEGIDVTIDLHEASPEYPVINAIVAHERAMPLASEVILDLELDDITMGLEPSPKSLHGLTHRELGDATNTLALLMEDTNPSQGRLRGKTDEALILEGKDELYVRAQKLGRLFVPFDEEGWPLSTRVGRHMAGLEAIFGAFTSQNPGKPLVVGGMPAYEDLASGGLGKYL
ncbi:MAG: succinylglutamate desuccinylase [Spirochaetes bacterium]|nr:succinylglutamate desuccinylase [Spirochaetota bacterium]